MLGLHRYRAFRYYPHRFPKKIEAKLPKCINQNSINQLNRDIVAEYIAQGYPHTQIKFETTPERVLKLAVIEGKIREITGGSRTVNVDTLFPNHQGKPLNIQYLDQGIEQVNHVVGTTSVLMFIRMMTAPPLSNLKTMPKNIGAAASPSTIKAANPIPRHCAAA